MAARSGWTAMPLDYRLPTRNPYPAALEDCSTPTRGRPGRPRDPRARLPRNRPDVHPCVVVRVLRCGAQRTSPGSASDASAGRPGGRTPRAPAPAETRAAAACPDPDLGGRPDPGQCRRVCSPAAARRRDAPSRY
ncbi:hypothetical protein [Rhodococcus opacus]|uniref:hypothetical protein n=1 Tax=Rhodococcus opacus TaxID=37919 RepID=UPI003AFFEF00